MDINVSPTDHDGDVGMVVIDDGVAALHPPHEMTSLS